METGTDDALSALKAKMGMLPQVKEPAALGVEDAFPVPDIGVSEDDKVGA